MLSGSKFSYLPLNKLADKPISIPEPLESTTTTTTTELLLLLSNSNYIDYYDL